jgi:glycosyltransferase involved in cell wall biosynthesis
LENPLVSIIVPVYNAAGYLNRCLDSISRQDYRNIEVILVNDGSEDESLSICREYQRMDSRYRVIDKQNTGVSDTRNHGISVAKGKYLQFVDSDDWITEHATGTMVRAAESSGSDMVITHFYRIAGKHTTLQGHIREEVV